MKRGLRAALSVVVFLGLAAGFLLNQGTQGMPVKNSSVAASGAIPMAVLGDSDSHSYQDSISFPSGSPLRGGPLRARTFQWTEVLARLRGKEVDLGPWTRWGSSGVTARSREVLGLSGARAPQKEDYLYNFANSGASCNNLMGTRFRQAPRLVELINKQPEIWARGVVVIRIGLNNWSPWLDLQSRDPGAPELSAIISNCRSEISNAIAVIRAAQPSIRIMLIGLMNEVDDPDHFEQWLSGPESANIEKSLSTFNAALSQIANTTPNVAYFDNLAWFRKLWGSRNTDGKLDYKTVVIGPLSVTNSAGDSPQNSLLGDHHPGLVWNVLWAQALVAGLKQAFDLPLTPIGDDEAARFIAPLISPSKAPGS